MTLQEIGSAIRNVLDFRLVEVGGTEITGASVLTFFVILLLSVWFSRVFQRILTRILTRGGIATEGTLATSRRLLHYGVLILGFAVALQAIGISIATVFAAGAVAAVAIGFALQNILQNFVSGIILLGERSIKETDILEVEGTMVRIVRMGARATVARTREDEEIIIPNSILVQSTVKNLTLTDPVHRIRSRVGVSYASDMTQVEDVLTKVARRLDKRDPARDPVVHLMDFGDSSVVWEVSIWTADPWFGPQIRSELNKAIWFALKEAGITIAYPQLDVHLDPGVGVGAASEP
ncbi:MAG: mechanosensitive ion channel [Longimicrobiales bacterium]|nr:mechanosensitive ion channel [Longimicrobiales bacterium]